MAPLLKFPCWHEAYKEQHAHCSRGARTGGRQSEATLTVWIALSRTGILTGNAKQELARTGRVVLRLRSTLFPHWKPSAVGSSHCSFQFWELLLEVAEHSLARGGITAGFSGPVLRLPKRNGKKFPKLERIFSSTLFRLCFPQNTGPMKRMHRPNGPVSTARRHVVRA